MYHKDQSWLMRPCVIQSEVGYLICTVQEIKRLNMNHPITIPHFVSGIDRLLLLAACGTLLSNSYQFPTANSSKRQSTPKLYIALYLWRIHRCIAPGLDPGSLSLTWTPDHSIHIPLEPTHRRKQHCSLSQNLLLLRVTVRGIAQDTGVVGEWLNIQ